MPSNRTADVVRMEQIVFKARAPMRFGVGWVKEDSDTALEVARHIGGRHEELVKLALQGKNTWEIAKITGLGRSTVSTEIRALDAHVRFYKETGNFPESHEPTSKNRHVAASVVTRVFPGCTENDKRNANRAIALGLSGFLPKRAASIYFLRKAITKLGGGLFPEEIVRALKVRPRNVDVIESLRDKIQIAANRGDEAAKRLLVKPDSTKVRNLSTGAGLWRRHPDLVIGTALQPSFLFNIHPKSLATRKKTVDALAARGEKPGIAMQLLIAGNSREQIARKMKLRPQHLTRVLNAGVSAVFGIPPQGERVTEAYLYLTRKHSDLFQPKQQKRKRREQQFKEAA